MGRAMHLHHLPPAAGAKSIAGPSGPSALTVHPLQRPQGSLEGCVRLVRLRLQARQALKHLCTERLQRPEPAAAHQHALYNPAGKVGPRNAQANRQVRQVCASAICNSTGREHFGCHSCGSHLYLPAPHLASAASSRSSSATAARSSRAAAPALGRSAAREAPVGSCRATSRAMKCSSVRLLQREGGEGRIGVSRWLCNVRRRRRMMATHKAAHAGGRSPFAAGADVFQLE